ncbi:GNAT family N-acetyltransferase [Kribbella sp. CA-247076]|uniref:GNAT family N-acetyltransferase n=1 Tax=Kribbella sp. CA-247076 TaxID=3239941 RepID=UPI003D8D09C0
MVEVRAAGPDAWADVAAVMGERGDPARCFCQYFRLRGQQWDAATRDTNRRDLRNQVRKDDVPPGVLAYDGRTPVGWCAVGPRSSYPRVVASPNWRTDHKDAWVITCFVVPVGHRRQGLAGELALGAVEFARSQGAAVVEGCAVDISTASRTSSADLYRGPLSVFLTAGFAEISRTNDRWVLVRKHL